jgi:hypothetical protein
LSALAIARNDVAAARLYLLDDRQHIGRKAVCICIVWGCHFAFTGGDENMNPGISCGVAGLASAGLTLAINGKKSSDFAVLEDGIKGRKKREAPASNIISQNRR